MRDAAHHLLYACPIMQTDVVNLRDFHNASVGHAARWIILFIAGFLGLLFQTSPATALETKILKLEPVAKPVRVYRPVRRRNRVCLPPRIGAHCVEPWRRGLRRGGPAAGSRADG